MKSKKDFSSGFSSAEWGGGGLYAAACNIPDASFNIWSLGSVLAPLVAGSGTVRISALSSSLVCDMLLSS
jgi:hypothetical protein